MSGLRHGDSRVGMCCSYSLGTILWVVIDMPMLPRTMLQIVFVTESISLVCANRAPRTLQPIQFDLLRYTVLKIYKESSVVRVICGLERLFQCMCVSLNLCFWIRTICFCLPNFWGQNNYEIQNKQAQLPLPLHPLFWALYGPNTKTNTRLQRPPRFILVIFGDILPNLTIIGWFLWAEGKGL